MSFCSANWISRSPWEKLKLPWEGWTASIFMPFSAVTELNWVAMVLR